MERKPRVIAVCGKGGVGKTSISALMVRSILRKGRGALLAIDADPAVGLATSLGMEGYRTVDDVRNELIDVIENGRGGGLDELAAGLDYRLLETLEERGRLAFLAIGRPETEGCYCRVNDLLKDVIRDLAANFDYVVIDAEAGVEQVNRRVMEMVTHLVLVTDTSAKGRAVICTIDEIAGKSVSYERAGVVVNRVRSGDRAEILSSNVPHRVVALLEDEELIRRYDMDGKSLLDLPRCGATDSVDSLVAGFIDV